MYDNAQNDKLGARRGKESETSAPVTTRRQLTLRCMGQLCSRTLPGDAPEDEGGSCDASQPSEGGVAFGQLSAQNLAAIAVPLPALLAPFCMSWQRSDIGRHAGRDELQLIANKLSVPEWARTLAQVRFGLQATCVLQDTAAGPGLAPSQPRCSHSAEHPGAARHPARHFKISSCDDTQPGAIVCIDALV